VLSRWTEEGAQANALRAIWFYVEDLKGRHRAVHQRQNLSLILGTKNFLKFFLCTWRVHQRKLFLRKNQRKEVALAQWHSRVKLQIMSRRKLWLLRQDLSQNIFRRWVKYASLSALRTRTRNVQGFLEAQRMRMILRVVDYSGHRFRRYRNAFYHWVVAAAVAYESTLHQTRSLHRLKTRQCLPAFHAWLSHNHKNRCLEDRTVKAVALGATRSNPNMLIPVTLRF